MQRSKEVGMNNSKIAVLTAVALSISAMTPVLAQGGGSGSAGGGATTGTAGGTAQQTQPSSQTQSIQDQKNAATTGSNTAPAQNYEGAVSGPGVGVGTATNGKPIGSPGSGLGSPEDPVDAKKLR
jgi:hypothetical protein